MKKNDWRLMSTKTYIEGARKTCIEWKRNGRLWDFGYAFFILVSKGTFSVIWLLVRLREMVSGTWVCEQAPLNSQWHYSRKEALISTILGLLTLYSKNVLGL